MTDIEFDINPDELGDPITGEGASPATKTAPGELTCPVCERVIPSPMPNLCPFCQSPIQTISAILRTADLSIDEAMRDLRSGLIDQAAQRLDLVRVSSRRHRLKVEVIQAMISRLKGDPSSALAILASVKDKIGAMDDFDDDELIELIGEAGEQARKDQKALASCCEHYNFALYQAKNGNLEEARRSLRAALREVPSHAPSHALLGKVQLALQDEDDARYHLRRALASDPANATAVRYLTLMGERTRPNPVERIRAMLAKSPALAGSIIIVIILAFIALAALLSNR